MAAGKGDSLTSGEAAQYLHLSVDTVNDLADRGILRCTRTPGGHRRFMRSDLDAYQRRHQGGRAAPPAAPRTRAPAPPRKEPIIAAPGYYYDAELDDVFPIEPEVHLPSPAPPPPPPPPPDPATVRVPALKQYGLDQIPWGVPDGEKGKVVQALERYVIPANIPGWIVDSEARGLVKAKVEEALKPYYAAVARRELEVRAAKKVEGLIETGRSHAVWKTLNWDAADRDVARRDVERHLKDVVESDWTDDDVKDEADQVLAEWVEVDYDDDDSDEDEEVDEEEGDPEYE